MPQLVNLFLVIGGVIAMGVGLVRLRHDPFAALWLMGGGAVVTLAYISDKRREKRKEERSRRQIERRTVELARASTAYGRPVTVPHSLLPLLVGVHCLVAGLGALYFGIVDPADGSLIPWSIAGFFFPIAMLLLSRGWASLGKPRLELLARGVVLPLYGSIAWSEVTGIHLQSQVRGGREYSHLMLRIPRFGNIVSPHWTDRALARIRLGPLAKGVLSIPLSGAGEPPQAVYAVARQLWTQATARDHDWLPGASDAFNEALGRIGQVALERGAERAAFAEFPSAGEAARLQRDLAVIAAEARRQSQRGRVVLAIVLLLIGLRLLLLWWRVRFGH